ncbi:hypothetical protein CAPTEDRAFT_196753 [Capitella teleta]|uniref:Uncharacterized protein n=1 Tax=Capitella teleta TaxID=283909 RepID=R7T3Z5_CAPTE|nr:hypothetical protein CAPTEDRAFT_196753 [Capitella teleta]|eukprot:ELT87518.1 hypothetical protein CAPTEDRAFT_196753 [Capitella teleta]
MSLKRFEIISIVYTHRSVDEEEILRRKKYQSENNAMTHLLIILRKRSEDWFTSFSKVMEDRYPTLPVWNDIKEASAKWLLKEGAVTTQQTNVRTDVIPQIHVQESKPFKLDAAPSHVDVRSSVVVMIDEAMRRVETILSRIVTVEDGPPDNFATYDKWLDKMNKQIKHKKGLESSIALMEFQRCSANLRAYNTARKVQHYIGDQSCVDFLEDEMSKLNLKPGSLNEIYRDMSRDLNNAVSHTNSPRLETLKQRILEANKDHPEWRIVVQCNSADVGNELNRVMDKEPRISHLKQTDKIDKGQLLIKNVHSNELPSHDHLIVLSEL